MALTLRRVGWEETADKQYGRCHLAEGASRPGPVLAEPRADRCPSAGE
jgi:hypothetical protein